ncbi:hypothetical protein NFI96_020729, partial [Prochilodus magdalenae]
VIFMEPAWRQQGRGRGRGQGRGPTPADLVPGRPQRAEDGVRVGRGRGGSAVTTLPKTEPPPSKVLSTQSRFDEIRKSNQAAAQRLAEKQYSSSSDEDEDDDEDGRLGKRGRILQSTLTTYTNQTGGDVSDLERTRQYLNEAFQSGAITCLICIASVKRTQAVWSCVGCYSIFHIPCIQKWAKDSVFLVSSVTDEDFGKKDHPWPCPKCRYEYSPQQTPCRYYCYCGKEVDPAPDPWLLPHSCGQVCDREFKPPCGHRCLLLCHPGVCAACVRYVPRVPLCAAYVRYVPRACVRRVCCMCPVYVRITCVRCCCALLPRRCSNKRRVAVCAPAVCVTLCAARCPAGSTPARTPVMQVRQACFCRRSRHHFPTSLCVLSILVCGRPLPCGHHTCERVCHAGACGECPRAENRTCPCGKSKCALPCTADVPTCGDTCDKKLDCGLHTCSMRCHKGPCETCRQEVEKQCRCGRYSKRMPCHKEYLCESKCNQTRSCNRHQCRRKCCPGNCPPCDLNCGRTLGCRNHKCPSVCHPGNSCDHCVPVQPVAQTVRLWLEHGQNCCGNYKNHTGRQHSSRVWREVVQVKCACGSTSLSVPCGREKSTKPPRCKELCRWTVRDDSSSAAAQCSVGHPLVLHQWTQDSAHRTLPTGRCPQDAAPQDAAPQDAATHRTLPTGHCPQDTAHRTLPTGRCPQDAGPQGAGPHNPPTCHHPARERHRCHFGTCPVCKQVCQLPLPGCAHLCPAPCHDQVLLKTNQRAPLAGPWEQPAAPAFECKALPCPPCQVPIPTACLGEHEVTPVPCHARGPFSCGRPCGRTLTCSNHSCSLLCHSVTPDPKREKTEAGKECEQCEEGCSKPRPSGCSHPCALPCHRGDCPPCSQMTRQRCHCRITNLYIECLSSVSVVAVWCPVVSSSVSVVAVWCPVVSSSVSVVAVWCPVVSSSVSVVALWCPVVSSSVSVVAVWCPVVSSSVSVVAVWCPVVSSSVSVVAVWCPVVSSSVSVVAVWCPVVSSSVSVVAVWCPAVSSSVSVVAVWCPVVSSSLPLW